MIDIKGVNLHNYAVYQQEKIISTSESIKKRVL